MDSIVAGAESHFDPRIVVALQRIINRDGERVLENPLQTANGIAPF